MLPRYVEKREKQKDLYELWQINEKSVQVIGHQWNYGNHLGFTLM